jgi:hypothetical protein
MVGNRGDWVGLAVLLVAPTLACGGRTTRAEGTGGSETNWLGKCTSIADCTSGDCICGSCTLACSDSASCSSGPPESTCAVAGSSALEAMCGASPLPAGACLPPCGGGCANGTVCVADHCVPVRGADAGLRANGQRCSQASECASLACAGQGCGPDEGICIEKPTSCILIAVTYCGCDGRTFYDGACTVERYAHQGACEACALDDKNLAWSNIAFACVDHGWGCGLLDLDLDSSSYPVSIRETYYSNWRATIDVDAGTLSWADGQPMVDAGAGGLAQCLWASVRGQDWSCATTVPLEVNTCPMK